ADAAAQVDSREARKSACANRAPQGQRSLRYLEASWSRGCGGWRTRRAAAKTVQHKRMVLCKSEGGLLAPLFYLCTPQSAGGKATFQKRGDGARNSTATSAFPSFMVPLCTTRQATSSPELRLAIARSCCGATLLAS